MCVCWLLTKRRCKFMHRKWVGIPAKCLKPLLNFTAAFTATFFSIVSQSVRLAFYAENMFGFLLRRPLARHSQHFKGWCSSFRFSLCFLFLFYAIFQKFGVKVYLGVPLLSSFCARSLLFLVSSPFVFFQSMPWPGFTVWPVNTPQNSHLLDCLALTHKCPPVAPTYSSLYYTYLDLCITP